MPSSVIDQYDPKKSSDTIRWKFAVGGVSQDFSDTTVCITYTAGRIDDGVGVEVLMVALRVRL